MTVAARLGDISTLQTMINLNLDKINGYSEKYCNPICMAASQANTALFLYLYEKKVPFFPCKKHPSLLTTSSAIIQILLSPNFHYKSSYTPKELYEAVQFLIRKQKIEETLLMIDSFDSKTNEIEKELLQEIQKDAKNKFSDKHKPLILIATEYKLIQIIEMLVHKGFDINAIDKYGWNAFICACSTGYIEGVKWLFQNGALIDKKDFRKRTALHYAAQHGHENIVKEIVGYGANVLAKCDQGFLPAKYANLNGRSVIEQFLHEKVLETPPKNEKDCRIF